MSDLPDAARYPSSKPSYEELLGRHEMLRHRCIALSAELVVARKARTAEVNRYADRHARLLRDMALCIEDLEAWKARLNPWTAQGWQWDILVKLVLRLTAASDSS